MKNSDLRLPARGFTMLEIVIVVAGLLLAYAVPAYERYLDRTRVIETTVGIGSMQKTIRDYEISKGKLPDDLADVGYAEGRDPWGRSYEYLNLRNMKGNGKARKDKSLAPAQLRLRSLQRGRGRLVGGVAGQCRQPRRHRARARRPVRGPRHGVRSVSLALPAMLRTRVARRLFVMFVLSAFVPLALIAAISLTQVRELLLLQGEQRLSALAKNLAMVFFDRLVLAGDVASGVTRERGMDAAAERIFDALAIVDPAGRTVPVGQAQAPPVPEAARTRAASGRIAAFTLPHGSGRAVAMRGGHGRGRHRWSAACGRSFSGARRTRPRTRPISASWRRPPALSCIATPLAARVPCARSRASHSIFHAPGSGSTTGSTTARGRGPSSWAPSSGPPTGSSRRASPRLLLHRLAEFQQVYVPAVVLAFLMVTWLTARQSRHIVEPVIRLAQRAREIAAGRFAGRMAMRRDDEFGELGDAFDGMSERLGRQFASLKALSEIDELILSTGKPRRWCAPS